MRTSPAPLLVLLCLALASGCPDPLDADGWIGPADRLAAVWEPAQTDTNLPVVFVLGGYANRSRDLAWWLDIEPLVERFGALLILPDGTVDSSGANFWNATDTCCDFDQSGVDDVAYLEELIVAVRANWDVDEDQFHIVGHSNGGFMGYRMACQPDSPFDGLLSIAGSSWLDPERCDATHPIALLQVHGDQDDIMPIEGDESAPGARAVVDRWGARAECQADSFSPWTARELIDDGVDNETRVERFALGCQEPVELWTVAGAGHDPDFRPEFIDQALTRLITR